MKHFITLILTALFITAVSAQNIQESQFYTPVNTGSNMTLGFNTDDLDDFIGDLIGAFNSEGTCIGMESIKDEFFSMALWGNDQGTQAIDGLMDGETPIFAIQKNDGTVVSVAGINNFTGYVTNDLKVATSISLSGCTSETYLEFHTQGYTADVDDGSCQTKTYTLDVTPNLFEPISFTDNNMIIGINDNIVNEFAGGSIGAFIDLDGDGTLDCISTADIPGTDNDANGFFTISLWGDDQLTDEVDGLTDGQTPIFAILTPNNYVLAFESADEFTGYAVNAFITFDEIVFDLTIYGCTCLLYTSPSPRDVEESRMPSSA